MVMTKMAYLSSIMTPLFTAAHRLFTEIQFVTMLYAMTVLLGLPIKGKDPKNIRVHLRLSMRSARIQSMISNPDLVFIGVPGT
jgi:hypothetical protein